MKTLIVTTSMFGNAVSDYYKNLGSAFVENKYRVIFVFDGMPKITPENSRNILYYSWPSRRPTKFVDFIFFCKLLLKYSPQICISNFGSTNIVSIASYLFRIKNRINYVHTTTTQINLDSKNILKTRLLRLRKKYIYKLNTLLFTNSDGNKFDIVKNFNFPKEKIIVFPLLIKPSSVTYKNKTEREQTIVIVGRLDSSNGHEALLHQFSKCVKQYPELRLKVVGSGELLPKLKDISEELQIANNIDFLGNVSRLEINAIFSSSLISVSASYEEAFGLVNIEALREGTQLLCTKTAGSIDILKDSSNGLFFDMNIENSLLNSLEKILSNWEKYSKKALNRFNSNYNQRIVTRKHFERIKEIIKN